VAEALALDEKTRDYCIYRGTYGLEIGASSDDIRWIVTIQVR